MCETTNASMSPGRRPNVRTASRWVSASNGRRSKAIGRSTATGASRFAPAHSPYACGCPSERESRDTRCEGPRTHLADLAKRLRDDIPPDRMDLDVPDTGPYAVWAMFLVVAIIVILFVVAYLFQR